MTDRTVTVRVRADVAQAKRELAALGYEVQETGKRVQSTSDAWDKVGTTATRAGLAGAAALGLTAKAAIDWETAWAGVTKTVNGTDAQMAQLEDGLRNLATTTLPATHEEIAGVAEAAGQLGVKREDILGFTKTMIDLGVSTNLTADEAATSLAQIGNVMGTMAREGQVGVQRLGSTLVALGNAGASTEKDIVQMAQRIAGAGAVVGASESDVLALANAMSSLGIEAQLGGGVMSRVLIDINSSVLEGGGKLQAYADVAGETADVFAKKWREDPVRAVDDFVQGLRRIKDQGGDVAGTLKDLGLKGTENASVLLRLTGAGDLLTQSLDLGNKAWEQNNALVQEANKRYETTASKLAVAKNALNDAAISAGDVLLPTITDLATGVRDLANGFSDLDPDVQSTIVKLAVATTGVLLLTGGSIKAVQAVRAARNALETLGVSAERSGKVLAKTAAGMVALVAAGAALNALAPDKLGVDKLTQELLKSDDAVASFNDRLKESAGNMTWLTGGLTDFKGVAENAFNPSAFEKSNDMLSGLFKTVSFGVVDMTTNVSEAEQRIGELDSVLSGLVANGNAAEASKIFNQFAAAAKEQGVSVEELQAKLPDYANSLAAVSNSQSSAADSSSDMADGFLQAKTEADLAEISVKEYNDQLDRMNGVQLDARASARNVAQAIMDAGKAAESGAKGLNKTRTAFDLTTKAGLENEAALDSVAQAMNEQIKAAGAAGASQQELDGKMRTSRDQLYKTALRFGLTKDAAKKYVEEVLGIPTARSTEVKLKGVEEAKAQAKRIQSYINGIHGKDVKVNIRYNDGVRPNGGRDLQGGQTKGFAEGGYHLGAGTSTSDDIPVWVSTGEYTVRAAAVQRYGVGFLERVNSMRFADGGYHGAVPTDSAAAFQGPLQISGVLDLGNGLRGMVRGEIAAVATGAGRSR